MESAPLDETAVAQKEFAQQFGNLPARGRGGVLASLMVLLAFVLFFSPVYARHFALSNQFTWFNDDARQQIWPLMRYYDDTLFHENYDYVADYYLACFPIGYRALYAITGVALDARVVSKWLPYLLLALTALAAGRAARRLRGPPAGWATAALIIGGHVYLDRMAGALPRGFAFPLLAVAMLALVRARPILLAVTTILAAGFYPAAAVVSGLSLALWLLLPAGWLGKASNWRFQRRLIVLAVAGLLTVAMVLPLILTSQKYGGVLRPSDAGAYPELSAAGRYTVDDRGDAALSPHALLNFLEAPLAGLAGDWEPSRADFKLDPRSIFGLALLGLGIVGYVALARTSSSSRRALLLPLAAILAYFISIPLAPLLYLPSRYQLFPLAISAAVIVPAGIAHLASLIFAKAGQSRVPQVIVLIATIGVYVALFTAWNVGLDGKPAGPSDLASAGLYPFGEKPGGRPTRQVVDWDKHREALIYIRRLSPNVLIGGWPANLDNIPYLTARPVLMTRETHQVFHRAYADQMRERMRGLIVALYDPDPATAQTAVEKLGITHLLVSQDLYAETPPTYFAPFNEEVKAARSRLGKQTPGVMKLKLPVHHEFDDWTILDFAGKAEAPEGK